MEINLTGRNCNLNDDLKEIFTKELGELQRFYRPILSGAVTVTEEKSRYSVEVILQLRRNRISGKNEGRDIRASLDRVIPKLKKQLERLKSKQRNTTITHDDLIKSGKILPLREEV